MTGPRFIPVAEAASRLDMDESTVRRHRRNGVWPFDVLVQKVGGRWKVSEYQLDRYIRGELVREDGAA